MPIYILISIVAVSFWIISGTLFFYIAVPLLVVLALLLVIFAVKYKSTVYKYIAIFFINILLGPVYLVLFSMVISFISSSTTKYYIGVDIQTPDGVVSAYNKVTLVNKKNPIYHLRNFYNGYISVSGEACYSIISEKKTIIVLLSPLGSNTLNFLQEMPDWVKQTDLNIKGKEGNKRYIIPEKMAPGIVLIKSLQQTDKASLVTSDSFSTIVGPKYSLINSWVTFEKPKTNESHSIQPWLYPKETDQNNRLSALKSLGIPQDRFVVYWKSDEFFLRI